MDAKTARTLNIRDWVAAAGGPAEFANHYGDDRWVQSQVSQWISASNPKGIGHALARAIERRLGKSEGAMDRHGTGEVQQQSASQPAGLDLAKLDTTVRFFEDLFAVHRKLFVASERGAMITELYDFLTTHPKPNWVEISIRYNRQLEEENRERQGEAGRAGEDDQRATAKRTLKAKAQARSAR